MSAERIRQIRDDVKSALVELPPAEKVMLARVLYDAIEDYSPAVWLLADVIKQRWDAEEAAR